MAIRELICQYRMHLMRLNVIFLKNVSAVQISRPVLHQEMYLPEQSHVM